MHGILLIENLWQQEQHHIPMSSIMKHREAIKYQLVPPNNHWNNQVDFRIW